MSKKKCQNMSTEIKTQIVNTNKNILEKIKNLFKILALYIAPIIGGIFLPLIIHYHLLEKIYSFFSNNKHFYVLLYSIILLVVIFWERIQILKDYLKFPKFMKVFIDFVEFLLSLFFSLLFSIIYFLIIEKYTSFSIENNETTSFIFFTIIILTFFFISTINRRKIFNYIKNNNFSDEDILKKVRQYNPDKIVSVEKRIKTFQEFLENIEKGVIVEKTYSNTTIKSDYFIVQSKGNNFLHLGL